MKTAEQMIAEDVADGAAPNGEHVPSHFPLTRDEVRVLLEYAWGAVHRGEFCGPLSATGVQCRLDRGVPGLVCPHQIDGPVAVRVTALGGLYVDFCDQAKEWGATPEADVIDAYADAISGLYRTPVAR